MKHKRTVSLAAVLGLALAGSVAALPALGQSASDAASAERDASRQERFQARLEARLDRMAERLQLEPGQQAAWTSYAQTVKSLFAGQRARPPADADAAALLRFRAERAAEHAKRLTQLAEATETLQYALNDEQRETLKKMMRFEGRGKHARHRGHGHKS